MCRQMHHYSFTQLIDSAEIGLKGKNGDRYRGSSASQARKIPTTTAPY